MDIIDFLNAVSAGNTEKVREFHSEHPQLQVNRNLHIPTMRGLRSAKLPLIIAFYEGRLETAKYLYSNGASLDVVCQKCEKTPREFMPEGFPEGSCRIMSFRVFKERVYETAFKQSFRHQRRKVWERLRKSEALIREMYEYATNEELFRISGTDTIKKKNLREWLHISEEPALEEKLKLFRNGDYLWSFILATVRQIG